jgi:mannose-6-phosphate isomerase
MLYPLTFAPLIKERIWGGRQLEQLFQKTLPPECPIGESWEISDRPGDSSVIDRGPLKGSDLHWVMQNHGEGLLGWKPGPNERFPLLVKILDAREKLSLQVHPPAEKAAALSGEPKTEMWYIAQADPGAQLFVGLKKGVTQEEFQQKIKHGTVAECFHRLNVKAGDAMFLPSGRVHAIGAGLVIFEIQQNSDTTYRVFDWNRVGPDGKPRALHVAESLASIDFGDFEPGLVVPKISSKDGVIERVLVKDPLFQVVSLEFDASSSFPLTRGKAKVIGVVKGTVTVGADASKVTLCAGQFCLLPACLVGARIDSDSESAASVLLAEPGRIVPAL